jgi:hypothetical protein
MGKKDIGKILTTGSPKQRALLIAEDVARSKYFQEKLLTDSEFNQISESFKTPREIKLWNEFRELDRTISVALGNLQGKKVEVLMNYSTLRGYILLWNAIENAELLVNSVLHEIKDRKERKRIAKRGADGVSFLFSKTEPDQEGYIEIKIDQNGYKGRKKIEPPERDSLWEDMNRVKKQVETSVIGYLSWERATLDFMEERGFNIKTYKEAINVMNKAINTPIINVAKYNGDFGIEHDPTRLDNVIKKYAICPIIEELEVDETEYNWFRRYFLDGKDYPEELRGKINKGFYNE